MELPTVEWINCYWIKLNDPNDISSQVLSYWKEDSYCYWTELNQLIGVFLLKGRRRLFNINNHLGIDCAREREMDTDQSAQALTQKKKQKQKSETRMTASIVKQVPNT